MSDGGSAVALEVCYLLPVKVLNPRQKERKRYFLGGIAGSRVEKLLVIRILFQESYRSVMEFGEEPSPALAFEKDAFELSVEDVYDISYVIGRDLLKISSKGEEVSDLQFRIVRVLEMFETLVNKYNLSLEELKMERDNLKSELDRIIKESSSGQGTQTAGPNQLLVDLTDPNRPRFTMQELKEVLQERNQLKAQLMVAQEELQLYKSGILPQAEPAMVEVDLKTPDSTEHSPSTTNNAKEEKTTIGKLFSFRRK
ncbi:RILP-like protein 2 [Etheostoma cragini]|uniref:RILP-like protein 2 n=1 Tax=Etheostoma cragini TaxID=417921 RepID=UPI00155EDB90|nr:RILP-like protein 2 [Etheostoma cragini]